MNIVTVSITVADTEIYRAPWAHSILYKQYECVTGVQEHVLIRIIYNWSSGQSSRLQIQRSGFDSRRYQIFWEVVGLERGPLRFVNTIEELLGRKSSGSGLENRNYGRRGSAALATVQPSIHKS
jgi:hypothetical protein